MDAAPHYSPAETSALAAACAPGARPLTLVAISEVESGLDPLAIGINGPERRTLRPASLPAALALAARLDAAGANFDLGLAQINIATLRRLGLSLADAFVPCRNLAAAGRVIAEGEASAPGEAPGPALATRTALSLYNTGDRTRGLVNGYVGRVEAAALRLRGGAWTDGLRATAGRARRARPASDGAPHLLAGFVLVPGDGAAP